MKALGVNIWYWLCKYVLIVFPASTFSKVAFYVNCKRLSCQWYKFNLNPPSTFNEKLNYIKLHDRNPLSPVVADKVRVRDYVKDTVGESYLIPCLGVYERGKEVNENELPQKFVIKTNHGSGWNLLVNDKAQHNWPNEKRKLDIWLGKNSYFLNREWQYKQIKPLLICEEMLEFEIKDYKFFCSNGEAKYVQVDADRFSNHKRSIYTADTWEDSDMQIRYSKTDAPIPRPTTLDEMREVASKLSQPFVFCRVDLYEHAGRVYFGEITIHPGGGIEPFTDKQMDLKMGELIDLSLMKESYL